MASRCKLCCTGAASCCRLSKIWHQWAHWIIPDKRTRYWLTMVLVNCEGERDFTSGRRAWSELTSPPGFTARSRKDWGEPEGQCKGCLYNNHSISPGKVGVQPVPNLDISLCGGNTKGQETPGASAPLKSSSRYQILNRKISYLIKCGKYLKMFQSCKGADEGQINVSARKDLW